MLSRVSDASFEGLLIVGAAKTHELESAKRFAKILHNDFGLTLVLISRWKKFDVPGFDGLILDQSQEVVANFSLKTRLTEHRWRLTKMLRGAFERAETYSTVEGWVNFLLQSQFKLQVTNSPDSYYQFPSCAVEQRFGDLTKETGELLTIFAPESGRPTWVLFDGSSGELFGDAFRDAQSTTLVENRTILAINAEVMVTMHAGKSHVTYLRKCERALTTRESSAREAAE